VREDEAGELCVTIFGWLERTPGWGLCYGLLLGCPSLCIKMTRH